MTPELNKDFWSERYESGTTGWDLGNVSSPLNAYFDQLSDKTMKILIPGCGNAYEAEHLAEKGFENVFVIDLVKQPLENLKNRSTKIKAENCIHGDFFDYEGAYDLIVEQTFFCAIDPTLRDAYARKVKSLLKPGGKLVGVMFCVGMESGPPFGGTIDEYTELFGKYFNKVDIEPCYNSIKPRKDRECFVRISN